MSDSYITIVPDKAKSSEINDISKKIKDWLVGQNIIENELTDCVLGSVGYAPGSNYQKIIEEEQYPILKKLSINGLSIVENREVFHSGSNELKKISCPKCNHNIVESDWGSAIDQWYEGEKDEFSCPKCNNTISITKYTFTPTWAFGNLGFTFWNYPKLDKEFLREFETIVGSKIKVVEGLV